MLLADAFAKFRNRRLANSGLCPSHYLSVPAIIWDAMLSLTKVELELISDIDMHLLFEKGMKSGVSYISERYSNANEYLMSYNSKKPTKSITYLDKNNLYGYAMLRSLSRG